MKAVLKNYRQSPRKVRLVANLIKGKPVDQARTELSFLVKRAALPFAKLLDSAVANAKTNFGLDANGLVVKNVTVDKGLVMKRRMPRARGSAFLIQKRSSHIAIELAQGGPKEKKAKAAAPAEKAPKAAPAKKPARAKKIA